MCLLLLCFDTCRNHRIKQGLIPTVFCCSSPCLHIKVEASDREHVINASYSDPGPLLVSPVDVFPLSRWLYT